VSASAVACRCGPLFPSIRFNLLRRCQWLPPARGKVSLRCAARGGGAGQRTGRPTTSEALDPGRPGVSSAGPLAPGEGPIPHRVTGEVLFVASLHDCTQPGHPALQCIACNAVQRCNDATTALAATRLSTRGPGVSSAGAPGAGERAARLSDYFTGRLYQAQSPLPTCAAGWSRTWPPSEEAEGTEPRSVGSRSFQDSVKDEPAQRVCGDCSNAFGVAALHTQRR
jgi:hypothetical protein